MRVRGSSGLDGESLRAIGRVVKATPETAVRVLRRSRSWRASAARRSDLRVRLRALRAAVAALWSFLPFAHALRPRTTHTNL